jgi:hypothetical protein
MATTTCCAALISLLISLQSALPASQPEWRAKFNGVYGLAPDQVLKHVEPPFISERAELYHATLPDLAARDPDPTVMIIHWDREAELGPCLFGADVRFTDLLLTLTSLPPYEFDVDADIAEERIRGDWIVRKGAEPSKVIEAFVGHVDQATNRKIAIKREEVEEDAIIASGEIPADPSSSVLNLKLPLDAVRMRAPLRNTSDCGFFLRELSAATGFIVIDEREDKQQNRLLEWGAEDQTVMPELKRMAPDELETLLRSISDQTKLKFAIQPRKIQRWKLSIDK